MSKRNSEHSKSESSEELGAVARYAIDKLVPKITEEIEKSIKSPGHKGAIQVVQSVNYLAEGILSLL